MNPCVVSWRNRNFVDIMPCVNCRTSERMDDEWIAYRSLGYATPAKAEFRDRRIAELNAAFQTRGDDVLSTIREQAAERSEPCNGLPASSWELLLSVFIQCLEVFELQRRHGYYQSCPSMGDFVMLRLLGNILDIEYEFGGVLEEELMRVYRFADPNGAKLVLPRTAMEMRECVDSSPEQFSHTSAAIFNMDTSTDTPESALTVRLDSAGNTSISDYVPPILSAENMPDLTSFPFLPWELFERSRNLPSCSSMSSLVG